VQPKDWHDQKHKTAVVLLPGMGEFGYRRRHEAIALPLAEHGVASVILEGPFYGARMPPTQKRSKLNTVTDLLVLGRATIEEARSLLHWLKEDQGADSLVVAGCSMGGLHASMAGSMMPYATGIVAYMSPPSAGHAFCDGVLFNGLSKELKEMVADGGRCDTLLVERLRSFMTPTEIVTFPSPVRPDLAVITLGKSDEYVPTVAADVWRNEIRVSWNGCKVQEVDSGHVTGLLVERGPYRKSILNVVGQLQREAAGS